MKHILMAAFVLLLTISMADQTATRAQQCPLKLSQAPAVRGVKLDMTLDELFSLFPGLSDRIPPLSESERYPHFGFGSFTITPSNYATKERFAGIDQYAIRSFDGRVVGLDVYYTAFPTGALWRNTDDLVQRFSDSLHLPGPRDWAVTENYPQRKLSCVGFEIAVASANDRAQIGFYQQSWVQTQKQRYAAFEEKKRSEFKP